MNSDTFYAQKPICDITGIDEEWNNISGDHDNHTYYQNNRCSTLFKKGKNGNSYYLDAIIFKGEREYEYFTSTIEGVSSIQYIKISF